MCAEYGEPVIKQEGSVNPNSLAARLVRLEVYARDIPASSDSGDPSAQMRKVELEVPGRCTAYTLIGMVARRFAVSPSRLRLVWETGDWVPRPRDAVVEAGSEAGSESEDESGSEDGDGDGGEGKGRGRVMREVEIVPGTRSVGTWIEGMEATIRAELQDARRG